MFATITLAASLATICYAQQDGTNATNVAGATTQASTTTTSGGDGSKALTASSSVDDWIEYWVGAATAYVTYSKSSEGAADCGGVWSNVSSVLSLGSVKEKKFGGGKSINWCYSFYYGCAASVKNATIGNNVYPPDIYVYDESGQQKPKPAKWDAYATGMCKCKKPLLICLDALSCGPDNYASKDSLCAGIKKECNRGECPSRGVFCDTDTTCGWNQAKIDAYTQSEKAALLAMRAVKTTNAVAPSATLASIAAVLAFVVAAM